MKRTNRKVDVSFDDILMRLSLSFILTLGKSITILNDSVKRKMEKVVVDISKFFSVKISIEQL